MRLRLEVGEETYDVDVERTPQGLKVRCDGEDLDVRVDAQGPPVRLHVGKTAHVVDLVGDEAATIDGVPFRFHLARFEPSPPTGASGGRATVAAMMPGRIAKVLVATGQAVERGQALLVLEAMKMQNELASPTAGTVAELLVQEGDLVEAGRPLLRLGA